MKDAIVKSKRFISLKTELCIFSKIKKWDVRNIFISFSNIYSRFVFLLILALFTQTLHSQSLKNVTTDYKPQSQFEFQNHQPIFRNITVTQSGRVLAIGDGSPLAIGEDHGTKWRNHWIAHGRNFTDIAISDDKKTVWLTATTQSGGTGELYFSRDEGDTWSLYPVKLEFNPFSVVTTGDGSQVWVGGTGGKVVHAKIGDTTFEPVMNFDSSVQINVLRILDTAGSLLVAGSNGLIAIYRQPNALVEQPTCGLSSTFTTFTQDVNSGHLWLAGENGAICKSTDGGKTWKIIQIPYYSLTIYALAYEVKTNSLFVAGNGLTLEIQDIATGKWVEKDEEEIVTAIHYITVDENNNMIWAAGANAMLFRSAIGSDKWKAITPTELQKPLNAIASSADGYRIFAAGDQGSLRVSTDAGKTWQYSTVLTGTFYGIATDEHGRVAYAVGTAGALYRWAESTKQWIQQPMVTNEETHAIWISKDGTTLLLADRTGRIFRSTNSGQSWDTIPPESGVHDILRIASRPDENLIGAIANNGLVLISSDKGKSWQKYKVPGVFALSSIVFSKDRIWVGALYNSPLSYSEDDAVTWKSFSSVIEENAITDLAYAADSLWVISEESVMFSGDDGHSFSKFPHDKATYQLSAASVLMSGEAWFTTGGGEVISARKTSIFYPVLTRYELPEVLNIGANSGILMFSDKTACGSNELVVESKLLTEDGKLSSDVYPKIVWQNATTAHLSLTTPDIFPDKNLTLTMKISCGTEYVRMYFFTGLSIKSWYEKIPGGLNVFLAFGLVIIFPVLIILLYIIKPASLLRLRQGLDSITLPAPYNLIIRIFQYYLLVEFLITKNRVLDAWIEEVIPAFERRWRTLNFVKSNDIYFPLQFQLEDTTGTTHSFSELRYREISILISKPPIAVEIIGIGGIGKTTLAAALARSLLSGELFPYRALPLIFDSKIADLNEAMSSTLRLLLDDLTPDPIFTRALLRKMRIVPIFDRYSEQDETTQVEMKSAYSRLPSLQLCIFTSRALIDIDANICQLRPLPINSATSLTNYMEQELMRHDKQGIYASVSDRASLVAELARTLEADAANVITPLLATMFVELILKQKVSPVELKQFIPETTTELYLKYLFAMVASKGGSNFRYDNVVKAGSLLAEKSVMGHYTPLPFKLAEGIQSIEPVVGTQAEALINALIASGILSYDESRGHITLKFSIDMLAQVLAAYRLLSLNGLTDGWWRKFQSQIPPGSEFLRIVAMVRTTLLRSK